MIPTPYSKEKIKSFLRHFSVSGRLQEVVSIDIGHINATYKVTLLQGTTATSFILQKINTQIFTKPEAVMANISLVGHFLKKKNYPKPDLLHIKTVDK